MEVPCTAFGLLNLMVAEILFVASFRRRMRRNLFVESLGERFLSNVRNDDEQNAKRLQRTAGLNKPTKK
jgi:hypothetical protein